MWRDAWKAKEEAMRGRYARDCEKLSAGAKELEPLQEGDTVIIQNQHGRFPNKWERTGTIVEVLTFNQYIIKVHGSGRLTRRNRQFLRRYRQTPYYISPQSNQIPVKEAQDKVREQVTPASPIQRAVPSPSPTTPPPFINEPITPSMAPAAQEETLASPSRPAAPSLSTASPPQAPERLCTPKGELKNLADCNAKGLQENKNPVMQSRLRPR